MSPDCRKLCVTNKKISTFVEGQIPVKDQGRPVAVMEMKDIHKGFGKHPVLAGFSLSINQGEILGMLGPSGIGKSTILRMIAGLEKPDSGSIHMYSNRIGYVFQEPRLLPWDTALNNVILPLRAQGMDKSQAAERAGYFLHRMELSKFQTLYPHELSGGMRQRVALARALAITPDFLLLDEPFTGLDGKLKHSIRHLLETALEESKAAVLHVTHDPAELLDRQNKQGRQLGPPLLHYSGHFIQCHLLPVIPCQVSSPGSPDSVSPKP